MTDRYCGKCGSPLTTKLEGGRERPACPACGHIVFGRFSVGVGGLLIHEGQVLLVQRAHDPGKGRWTIPGGYVEEDEEPDKALEREVMEETGLKVRARGILAIRHTPTKDAQNLYIVFDLALASPAADVKTNGDGKETSRAGFYAPDALATLGEMGKISKWIAEQCRAEQGALQRMPPAIEDSLRYGPGWLALFAAPRR